MAWQKQEFNRAHKQRHTPFDKSHKICCLCKKWFPFSQLHSLHRRLWDSGEYEQVQWWYYTRNLRLPQFARGCIFCTIDCESCYVRFPLDHANRQGLCLRCISKHNAQEAEYSKKTNAIRRRPVPAGCIQICDVCDAGYDEECLCDWTCECDVCETSRGILENEGWTEQQLKAYNRTHRLKEKKTNVPD